MNEPKPIIFHLAFDIFQSSFERAANKCVVADPAVEGLCDAELLKIDN